MIDGAGHMMKLDPKGLEAAREQPGTNHEAIIRAYIDAIMPVRVSGLVERLRQYEGRSWETTYCYNGVRDEAGTSIENLSIGLATVWRGKLEAEDALSSERAAHAETKRERDLLADEWCDFCEAMGVDVDTQEAVADTLQDCQDRTEARLAEALKALEPFSKYAGILFELNFNNPDVVARSLSADGNVVSINAEHFFAARRVREGGKS